MDNKLKALWHFAEGIDNQLIMLDEAGNDVQQKGNLLLSQEQVQKLHNTAVRQMKNESFIEWEFYDRDKMNSFKVNSSKYTEGDVIYVHQLIDVTDYVGLNKEMSQYSMFYKSLSEFQAGMMNTMGGAYDHILSVYANLFSASKTVLVWNCSDKISAYSEYSDGEYHKSQMSDADEIAKWFSYEEGYIDADKKQYCCVAKTALDRKYAIIVFCDEEVQVPDKKYMDIANAYLENAIMKAQVQYNSEHDSMTGLFNKGKYMDNREKLYPSLDSVAIFNFDVNNLKKMNDTYGHEMGDKLLIKAAESIGMVTEDEVHGFRMGGDEYLMVACNQTEEYVYEIKRRWEEALAKLNTRDDGIDCVIALGLVYAKAPYNFDELLKKSDELMYEDKKAKKKPGEEIR